LGFVGDVISVSSCLLTMVVRSSGAEPSAKRLSATLGRFAHAKALCLPVRHAVHIRRHTVRHAARKIPGGGQVPDDP
jgi:hypothetical protein